jgi:hypothetical protein
VFYILLFLLLYSRRGGVFKGALVSASSLGLAFFFSLIIFYFYSYYNTIILCSHYYLLLDTILSLYLLYKLKLSSN